MWKEVTCLNLVFVGYDKKDKIREMAIGKIAAHLCLTLIAKELRISVEQGRVEKILNIIKY
jgi:hypothetical protein